MLTDEELEAWSESAAAAGDSETMLIAEIALGHKKDLDLSPQSPYACGPAVLARLRRYTVRGAQRIAAKWGSPYPDDAEG